MKTGEVIRVDTDHVLIRWEDNAVSMTDFQDGNNKAFSIGDKVVRTSPNQTWSWDLPKIIIKD